jgi:hypothetical protein
MVIDKSGAKNKNPRVSISASREANANVTTESDSHREKEKRQTFSTKDGMQIDESDEQPPNARRTID